MHMVLALRAETYGLPRLEQLFYQGTRARAIGMGGFMNANLPEIAGSAIN